jgi:hypothetical protein
MDSRLDDKTIMGLYVWIPGSTSSDNGEDKTIEYIQKISISNYMLTVISIIAVQGLGANQYYTWVQKIPKTGNQEAKEVT